MLNNIQNEHRNIKYNYNPTYNTNNEQRKGQRYTSSSISFRGQIKPPNEESLSKVFSGIKEALGGIFGSSKKSSITFTPVKQTTKTVTKSIDLEEMKFYDEIINEFSEIYPPKKSSNPIWGEQHLEQLHISGDRTIITRKFDNKDQISSVALYSDGEKLLIDLRENFLGIKTNMSTERLTQEFEKFLNGRQPSAKLFMEFVKERDIRHIQYTHPNLKEIRHSKIKADESERIEKLDYTRKEDMYKSLWRSYPTDKFYRIIGKSELRKLLKGETIVSLHPERKRIDITSNPNYNRIFFGEDKFRITFKQKDADGGYHERLTSQIAPCKPEYFHYTIHDYDINDIDINDIHMWDGVEWVKIKLQP